ncbi:MAG TPA: HAMP domain-containing sensor histidine kinase [bacterium]
MKKTTLNKDDELNLYLHTIVHELRNPLVSLQGYTKLLSEKLRALLNDDDAGYWDRILTSLDRLDELLADISKLAKVSVNEKDFKWIETRDIVASASELVGVIDGLSRVTLIVQPGLPKIYGDPQSLLQVFTNLISNACKYSHPNRDTHIEVGYLAGELFHKFYVKDNGLGIRLKDRDKVFRPFCRLEDRKNVGGSGLGLTIVKRIVEGHGGEIWLDSRLNQGVTVYFTLPEQLN